MPTLDGIQFDVEVADAMGRTCDVLVLKFAQHSYGLDRAVCSRLAQPQLDAMPEPGEHVVLLRPAGLAADAVLFLGVPELAYLDYREIRAFGRRAVKVTAAELPQVREICLTLHGAGFGLDEREAFRAEVAGALDGIAELSSRPSIRAVTFLEWEHRRADQMAEILAALEVEAMAASTTLPAAMASSRPASQRMREAGLDSVTRSHAFVAMPFGETFDDVFHYGIAGPVERAGLLCERMDRSVFAGDIVDVMKQRIRDARVVVADISGGNPNVYLEIGFAWASGVPTVLLCNQDTEPCFDVRGHRHLKYRTIREAERHLDRELAALVPR